MLVAAFLISELYRRFDRLTIEVNVSLAVAELCQGMKSQIADSNCHIDDDALSDLARDIHPGGGNFQSAGSIIAQIKAVTDKLKQAHE